MCSCGQTHHYPHSHPHPHPQNPCSCSQNKCCPVYHVPVPKPNYVLGHVLECPPPCAPNFSYPSPTCVDPVIIVKDVIKPPSYEPIYDITEYFNVQDRLFNILLNQCHKSIVGFFITFVDCYGYPIHLDDTLSTLKVEGVYQYNDPQNPGQTSTYYNVISDTQNKYYYTYYEQQKNGLPYNGCIWTLYTNSCNPLKLSFNLTTSYTGPINIYINLFLKPVEYPCPTLAPVVDECIESDPDECTGHIRWMVSLCCK